MDEDSFPMSIPSARRHDVSPPIRSPRRDVQTSARPVDDDGAVVDSKVEGREDMARIEGWGTGGHHPHNRVKM